MSDWTEIIIKLPAEKSDAAADIAQMTVPYGLYIEDYTDLEQGVQEIAHIDLIDEDLLKKDRTTALIHLYISPEDNPAEAIAFLTERYTAENIEHQITTASCRMEDWVNNWKQYFNPLPVGEKLLILPTWRQSDNPENRAVLRIDPGVAFGTGGHETTRLCLQTLEKYLSPGDTVLDIGCGSGILSIAAGLLGAIKVLAIDIDPVAVKTAVENVALNNHESKITVVKGNLAEKVCEKYKIIVANIVADAIINLSNDALHFMTDDSVYIMSGIIDTRLSEVLAALGSYDIIDVTQDGGWACVVAKLKS
ncbi:MAG: 50S ribosomal protein L11 methyltransferase [Oscillospiraceae bacterium]|jgi:ribosomal protein L11 methyltransferase|nr:50S ribosomal protein L11 methyltransferase [Oscillospiraceae bacterium]